MNSLILTRSSPAAMAQHFAAVSPRLLARIAGVLYLLIFIVAPSGAATATPLRMAVTTVCDAGVAFIFYALFKPVSRNLSMLALLFRLIFVALMTLDSLSYFGAVDLFHRAHSAHFFNMLDRLALVPFGVHCLLIGYLIYRSGFLARFLGVLMAIAGLTYVNFIYPWLVHVAFPYILIPGAVGEGLLTLWLLAAAVDSEHWAEKAGASRGPTIASGGNAT
ncbi:MAG: DUF4386 domain-containing protein [Steroidobacteraceae bacterium]